MQTYQTDWEKDFDELWERMRANGLGKKVSLDGRMIWDVGDGEEGAYSFADESVKNFISRLLQAREEWLRGEIEKMKLLEAAVNPETLMWKQRINGYLDRVLSLLTPKN